VKILQKVFIGRGYFLTHCSSTVLSFSRTFYSSVLCLGLSLNAGVHLCISFLCWFFSLSAR